MTPTETIDKLDIQLDRLTPAAMIVPARAIAAAAKASFKDPAFMRGFEEWQKRRAAMDEVSATKEA
jgi:hypothetical protein